MVTFFFFKKKEFLYRCLFILVFVYMSYAVLYYNLIQGRLDST